MSQVVDRRHLQMAALSIISLVITAYIDYITGFELVFSAAYLVPVCLCAWYFRPLDVWLMSLASGSLSWFTDVMDGHSYVHPFIKYANGFTCFIVSLISGLLLCKLKLVLSGWKKMSHELEAALEEVKASTEEIRRLQNGLQVVCAWTKRVRVGEEWMTPDEFLVKQLKLKISHGISPEAAREFEEEAARGFEQ